MRIDAKTTNRGWIVLDAVTREVMQGVLWVDDVTREVCQALMPTRFDFMTGDVAQAVVKAAAICISEERGLIEVWRTESRKRPPIIPPEVHNTRPINADDCMAAVRALCKGGA